VPRHPCQKVRPTMESDIWMAQCGRVCPGAGIEVGRHVNSVAEGGKRTDEGSKDLSVCDGWWKKQVCFFVRAQVTWGWPCGVTRLFSFSIFISI
jgi:hypothetical protein